MAKLEEGGNLPQRVVLVGGPKHGDFMNLPKSASEYRFVSDKMLSPGASWNDYPQNAEHIYQFDPKLSYSFNRRVFVHDSIWNMPEHGSFTLHALREAQKGLREAEDKMTAAQKERAKLQGELGDDRADLIETKTLLAAAERKLAIIRLALVE